MPLVCPASRRSMPSVRTKCPKTGHDDDDHIFPLVDPPRVVNDEKAQAERQGDPHSHAIVLEPTTGTIAFVPDLGMDLIRQFHFDEVSGIVTPCGSIPSGIKAGKRGLRFVEFPQSEVHSADIHTYPRLITLIGCLVIGERFTIAFQPPVHVRTPLKDLSIFTPLDGRIKQCDRIAQLTTKSTQSTESEERVSKAGLQIAGTPILFDGLSLTVLQFKLPSAFKVFSC